MKLHSSTWRFDHLGDAALIRVRVKLLSYHLRRRGVMCTINAQFRPPALAHRWSTAHGIVTGRVTMGALRALDSGRDQDGNVWIRPQWGRELSDRMGSDACAQIVQNAIALGPAKMVYAEEGYEPEDPRRLPNTEDIPVSRHVGGRAIDLNVDWALLGGPWSEQSTALVTRFGLRRPVPEEPWHVELAVPR